MASAKVANSTVNQSHRSIWSSNPIAPLAVATSRTRNNSTRAAPTSTTKITGFFISTTGFSLSTESFNARRRISPSNSGLARASLFGISDSLAAGDVTTGEMDGGAERADGEAMTQLQNGSDRNIVEKSLPSCMRKCSTIGPSDNAGKNVSAPTTMTVATSKPTKSGP